MTQNNLFIIGRKNQLRTDRDRMEGSMRRGEPVRYVRSFHQWKRDSADYLMENHESTASLGEREKTGGNVRKTRLLMQITWLA